MQVRIAPLRPEHLTQVLEIERENQPEPWLEHQFRQELASTHSHLMTAWAGESEEPAGVEHRSDASGESLVGYICFWCVADEVQIQNITVKEGFRRQGIGRRLLGYVLRMGCGGSARRAILEVRKSNTAAIGLYESYGFKITGERPGYYDDKEPALLMNLEL